MSRQPAQLKTKFLSFKTTRCRKEYGTGHGHRDFNGRTKPSAAKTCAVDTKTSSGLKTSSEIKKLGGAIFADRRCNHIFVYHHGAESYYAVREFGGTLRV